MMTDKSDHDIKVRATVKLSDSDIIWGANTSPVWESLFNKPWEKTCGLLIKQAFRFNKGMLSFLHWSVFRGNPGEKTTGLMLILVSVCFLILHSDHCTRPPEHLGGSPRPAQVSRDALRCKM